MLQKYKNQHIWMHIDKYTHPNPLKTLVFTHNIVVVVAGEQVNMLMPDLACGGMEGVTHNWWHGGDKGINCLCPT